MSDLLWKPPDLGSPDANGLRVVDEPSVDLASIGLMAGRFPNGESLETVSLFACDVVALNLEAVLPGLVTLPNADLARSVTPEAVLLIPLPS